MKAFIQGIGIVGPGFSDWDTCHRVLTGLDGYHPSRCSDPSPTILPANERRRSSEVVRWALEAAQQATQMAQTDPQQLPTVFASSGGETEILHKICHSLTQTPPMVSPTLFHQSVHNAAAGYWSIACTSQKASTSLSCYDSSLAGGLLEAMTRLAVEQEDQVLLVAYDIAAPPPLYEARPLTGPFAVALVLGNHPSPRAICHVDVELLSESQQHTTTMDLPELESLRAGNPAGHVLPLLQALARNQDSLIFLDFLDNLQLQIQIDPCQLYHE